MRPLVSVLIPAYNASRWINQTIASVRAQTYSPIETVVVDDGSTDNTLEVLRRLEWPGIKIVAKANGGPASARNTAFRLAQGDYIYFLDADDIVAPDTIEACVARLERAADPYAFAVSRWCRFWKSTDDAKYHEEPTFRDWDGFGCLLHILSNEIGGTQAIGTWVVPRPLIERVGPWREGYISPIDDGEYLSRILGACTYMYFSPRGNLFYRSGIGGLSSRRSPAHLEGIFRSLVTMTGVLRQMEDSARTRYATARTFQAFIYDTYPQLPQRLVREAEQLVAKYGGAPDCKPGGSPAFNVARHLVGWKAARRAQTAWRTLRAGPADRTQVASVAS